MIYTKLINFYLCCYLMVFGLFFSINVIAQEMTQEELDELNNLPSLELSTFLLSKDEYKVGEDIHGSFLLKNDRDYFLPNLKYTVSLVSNYDENDTPHTIYNINSFGPENLNPKEKKEINFIYKLPNVYYGENDYGLQLGIYTSGGILLGWSNSHIKIDNLDKISVNNLLLKDSYIQIDNEKRSLQEGPTIRDTREADLKVVVNNLSSGVMKVFPEIKLYNRTISGNLVNIFNPNIFTLLKGDNTLSINLNKLTYNPGVYEGILNLKNSEGDNLLPVVIFRYIVFGNIVTIQNASLDVNKISKNKTIDLDIFYTGSPIDISTGEKYDIEPMNTSIVLFDNNKNVFANYYDYIDYGKGTSVTVPLEIISSPENVKMEIKIFDKNNNVVSEYEYDFGTVPKSNVILFYIILLLVVLVVIYFIRFFIRR